MARRNRVDPWGDLHAVSERGLLTGNRGCLVDDDERVVRHHRSSLWIACVTEFQGRRIPLARPNRWTPIFFLDDAVALAAGHRPCAVCRRDAYQGYRDAVTEVLSVGIGPPGPIPTDRTRGAGRLLAAELDRRLVAERHRPGRGLVRAIDRTRWSMPIADLPDGTVVLVGNDHSRRDDPPHRDVHPHLVVGDAVRPFSFGGWGRPTARATGGNVDVLTPPTSVAALAHGFAPLLHPSATE